MYILHGLGILRNVDSAQNNEINNIDKNGADSERASLDEYFEVLEHIYEIEDDGEDDAEQLETELIVKDLGFERHFVAAFLSDEADQIVEQTGGQKEVHQSSHV